MASNSCPASNSSMSAPDDSINPNDIELSSPVESPMSPDSPTPSEPPSATGTTDDLPSIAKPLQRIHSFYGKQHLLGTGATATSQQVPPFHSRRPSAGVSRDRSQSPIPVSPQASPPPFGSNKPDPNLLCAIPHLCTIPYAELAQLDIMTREFAALDWVLDAGSIVQHVYILVAGAIEVFAEAPVVGTKRVGRLTAPNMFGMHNVLLDRRCKFAMRAGTQTTMFLLSRDDFFKLLRTHKVFATSVAPKIVDQLNVFQNFQTFCRAIFSISSGAVQDEAYQLNVNAILSAYGMLSNGIHRGQRSSDIDYLGWKHAIRRLPTNIVETYLLTLSRTLPPWLRKEVQYLRTELANLEAEGRSSSADRHNSVQESPTKAFTRLENTSFQLAESRPTSVMSVPTQDRRRRAYQVSRGHTFVMLREGFTEILDIVSCLCIHFIEAKKARIRLQSLVCPPAIQTLQEGIQMLNRSRPADQPGVIQDTLRRLKFNPKEVEGFLEMWPHSALHRLVSLLTSREEVVVRLDTSMARRFDTDPYLQWALSLRNRVLKALKLSDGQAIPSNTIIDILCCNTHTPKHLLCRFARENRDEILAWGAANKPNCVENDKHWYEKDDMLYYLASSAAGSDVEWGLKFKQSLEADGFTILDDPQMTGLQVDIIDVDQVDPSKVDSYLRDAFAQRQAKKSKSRHFILNLDFAFGAQADGITRALILTFGKQIRSVNVVSKAGGLRGNRGDIVLPRQLIFSKQVLGDDTPDEFRNTGNNDISRERVQELLGPARTVHTGPVLTIPGLVLQNEKVLKYYHRMWSCDGVEMEGSYYARQVEESVGLDLCSQNIVTRFGYHIVDLPLAGLQHSRVMSKPTAFEAVPPMYALGRAMLEQLILL